MGNSQTKPDDRDNLKIEAVELSIVKRNQNYDQLVRELVNHFPLPPKPDEPELERTKSTESTASHQSVTKEITASKVGKSRPTSRVMTRLAPLNTSIPESSKLSKELQFSPVSPTSVQTFDMILRLSQCLYSKNYLPIWFGMYAILHDSVKIKKATSDIYDALGQLEHARLSGTEYSFKVASNPVNKALNRYSDILPFDQCRIVLPSTGDYINATRLISPVFKTQYVSTQGPLPQTFCDFWYMVWEESCPVIVMLTKEEDSGRLKCHRYWPEKDETSRYSKKTDSEEMTFKIFNAETIDLMNGKIIIREFAVKRECRPLNEIDGNVSLEIRKVKLLQFLDWSDHGPCDPRSLLTVIDIANYIRSQKPTEWIIHSDTNTLATPGPMIVHCSAGVGRTAVFCTVDTVLSILEFSSGCKLAFHESLPKNDLIAITVNHFRSQRPGAIQSRSQFQLCYDAVLLRIGDWFLEGKSPTWTVLGNEASIR